MNLSLLHWKGLFSAILRAYARPLFSGERKRVAVTWTGLRESDRPIDRGEALRNVTASKFDWHISVAPCSVHAVQHLCLLRPRPDWKSSFPGAARRPRHARSPIPRGAPRSQCSHSHSRALLFLPSCDAASCELRRAALALSLSAIGGNNVRGSRATANFEVRAGLLRTFCLCERLRRRYVRELRAAYTEMLCAKIDCARSHFEVFMCRDDQFFYIKRVVTYRAHCRAFFDQLD